MDLWTYKTIQSMNTCPCSSWFYSIQPSGQIIREKLSRRAFTHSKAVCMDTVWQLTVRPHLPLPWYFVRGSQYTYKINGTQRYNNVTWKTKKFNNKAWESTRSCKLCFFYHWYKFVKTAYLLCWIQQSVCLSNVCWAFWISLHHPFCFP